MDGSLENTPSASSALQNSDGRQTGKLKSISCDICRRRKIKCDRQSPCSKCISSFFDCVYSEPLRQKKRKREVLPHRLDVLEDRLHALEASTPTRSHQMEMVERSNGPDSSGRQSQSWVTVNGSSSSTAGTSIVAEPFARLYHSIDKGDIEFQGYSADRTFIQGFKDELSGWEFDPAHKKLPNSITVSGLFDTSNESPTAIELPEKAVASKLTEAAIDGQVMFSVIHRPSFNNSFNLIYTLDQAHYSIQEWRFLALLYAVLAYGCLHVDIKTGNSSELLSQASLYYEKSKKLQDFAECKDIISLQAIFFKILFHLVVTRVFTSYTYASAALSVAIRMGLHKSLEGQPDFISREIGKRLFRGLWVLTNDVAATCGLPKLLSPDEIHLEPFLEIDDSCIERKRIHSKQQDEICLVTAANIYQKLQPTFHRISDLMYSEKCFDVSVTTESTRYTVSTGTLESLEGELRLWLRGIPTHFRLGSSFGDQKLLTAQFNLCISYAHVQLYLYRPFLQHFAKGLGVPHQNESPDLPWLAKLSIQACENIVMLCEDMYKRGLLSGGNWIVGRSIFSACMTLFYAVLVSSGPRQIESFARCFSMGRKISARLADRSVPAHRWKVMLTIMVATIPANAQHIQERLLEYDNSLPDLMFFEAEDKVADDAYTASLGEQSLSSFSSRSPVDIRKQGLSPYRLAALKFGLSSDDNATTTIATPKSTFGIPTTGEMQYSQGSAPILGCRERLEAGIEIVKNSSDSALSDLRFDIDGVGFGDMDDFLDLQSWL